MKACDDGRREPFEEGPRRTRYISVGRDAVKLVERTWQLAARACREYELIREGDRICVAVSGGKDSLSLAWALSELRRRLPYSFDLVAVSLDGGFPGYRTELFARWLENHGIPHETRSAPIYQKLFPRGKDTPCWTCGTIRRKALCAAARELGCNVLALGHQRDDFLVTFLLNAFFAGRLGALSVKDEDPRYPDLVIIRPLVYVSEEETIALAEALDMPLTSCCCPVVFGEPTKRSELRDLLIELEARHPGLKASFFAALRNVSVRELPRPSRTARELVQKEGRLTQS